MFDIFDQPWTMLGAAVIVLFVVLSLRAIFPDKKRWWQWLVPVLLAAVGFGLDFFVQSDLEKIEAVINTAVKAVEEENCSAIEALIAAGYRDSYHRTKKQLMRRCRARLSRPLVEQNITRIVSIEKSPPKAAAVFTVRIIFDPQSDVYQGIMRQVLVKVKLNLQKELDKRWLINRAEILEINMQPANWRQVRY